jgi:hypothetical protein
MLAVPWVIPLMVAMAIMVRVTTVAPATMVGRATYLLLTVGTTAVAIMAMVVAMAVEADMVVAGAARASYIDRAFAAS